MAAILQQQQNNNRRTTTAAAMTTQIGDSPSSSVLGATLPLAVGAGDVIMVVLELDTEGGCTSKGSTARAVPPVELDTDVVLLVELEVAVQEPEVIAKEPEEADEEIEVAIGESAMVVTSVTTTEVTLHASLRATMEHKDRRNDSLWKTASTLI